MVVENLDILGMLYWLCLFFCGFTTLFQVRVFEDIVQPFRVFRDKIIWMNGYIYWLVEFVHVGILGF